MVRLMNAKVRLYVDHPLGAGQPVALEREQAHYLFSVMRLPQGASVTLFNGRDGAWLAEVSETGKRGGTLVCAEQIQPQGTPPDLWLLFAPIKKARTDFIVEKAAEMGAARIMPVQTDFTNAERATATMQMLIDEYGLPKIAVHNAAQFVINAFIETRLEDYE